MRHRRVNVVHMTQFIETEVAPYSYPQMNLTENDIPMQYLTALLLEKLASSVTINDDQESCICRKVIIPSKLFRDSGSPGPTTSWTDVQLVRPFDIEVYHFEKAWRAFFLWYPGYHRDVLHKPTRMHSDVRPSTKYSINRQHDSDIPSSALRLLSSCQTFPQRRKI